jgi:hypothetical protein
VLVLSVPVIVLMVPVTAAVANQRQLNQGH